MDTTPAATPVIIIHRNACASGMCVSTPGVTLKPDARIHPNVTSPFPLYSMGPQDPKFEAEERIRRMRTPLKVRLRLSYPGSPGFLPDMDPVIAEADLFRGCLFDLGTFGGKPDRWGRSIDSWSLADEMLAQKPLQIRRIGGMVRALIVHNEIEFTCDLTNYADNLFDFAE